jgi:hypothetical protein
MMDAATRDLLQEIVRRESRSLLSYVGDAFPWTTGKGGQALKRLQDLVAAEREATAELGRYLTRRLQPLGYIGAYPTGFTTLNFMGLRHVLTRLVEWEKKSIRELEYDLSALRGDAEARALVEKMLALKRTNLETLEVLAAEQSPATVN